MKKLLVALAVMALAPFALAACGGDDSGTTAPETTAPETTSTTDAGGGGGSTVEISADPGGSLAFEQDSVSTKAGTVTVAFTNDSSTPHNVEIDGPDGEVGGTDTITASTTEATVELAPGEYTFYCSVPGHQEAGMEGALTAE